VSGRITEEPLEKTMDKESHAVHPYIPNSVPAIKRRMLQQVGAESTDEFYADIPEELRLTRPLDLPAPFPSEYALKRHVEGLLVKNHTASENLSFLGAGCYQHHVPAVCDEVNRRGEFLTAYAGEPYDDHGRFQALFEYASMMGELLNMANSPRSRTMSNRTSGSSSLVMSARPEN
jgi:glycine dehydrogenase subunit 1